MTEKFLNLFRNNQGSTLITVGAIASIILGIALIVFGFMMKKKDKSWWYFLPLLGIVSIITNLLKFI